MVPPQFNGWSHVYRAAVSVTETRCPNNGLLLCPLASDPVLLVWHGSEPDFSVHIGGCLRCRVSSSRGPLPHTHDVALAL